MKIPRVVMIGLLLAGFATADEQTYPELSSPQQAVRVYYMSLAQGDRATFLSCIHASDEHRAALGGMAELSRAILDFQKRLAKIDEAAAAEATPAKLLGYGAFLKDVDDMEVVIDGETAVSPANNGQPAVEFRRVDGKWKLDLNSVEAAGAAKLQAETIRLAVPKVRRHLDLVMTMVAEERITPKEAKGSVGLKIMSLMREAAMEAQKALRQP